MELIKETDVERSGCWADTVIPMLLDLLCAIPTEQESRICRMVFNEKQFIRKARLVKHDDCYDIEIETSEEPR